MKTVSRKPGESKSKMYVFSYTACCTTNAEKIHLALNYAIASLRERLENGRGWRIMKERELARNRERERETDRG